MLADGWRFRSQDDDVPYIVSRRRVPVDSNVIARGTLRRSSTTDYGSVKRATWKNVEKIKIKKQS